MRSAGSGSSASAREAEPVAIVGIGCRFPGAADPAAYWSLLLAGREAIGEVPPDRWDPKVLPRSSTGAPVPDRGGFLEQVDGIDWRALRIGPREASYMDPQHRLALEVAWEALEDAGLPLPAVAGTRTAVVMGVSWGDYQRMQARSWAHLDGYTAAGTPLAFAANRISHALDLRGPSFSVDATCSASLVAVSQACHALWSGQATLALAGGVSLMLSPDTMIMMARAGVLSPSGRCRALDARADGFVRGEGAGVVVLKPASQVSDDDRVYAWIRGVAVNHNGRNEWIMAPSAESQAAAIVDACRGGGVDPSRVEYIELHGTGFANGDVVEARALGSALGAGREQPCAIGSVKTNIGNLEAAAGVAGLIKVALALHHGVVPPTLNLEVPNPRIELEGWGLRPVLAATPWRAAGERYAGVSTTSLSGVNAHVVLASAAAPADVRGEEVREGRVVLPLSARTPRALVAAAATLAEWLDRPQRPPLVDVAYTAALRRTHHEHRLAVVGDGPTLVAALRAFVRGELDGAAPAADELEDAARRWASGGAVDFRGLLPAGGRCVSLPGYAWQRERAWLEWLDAATMSRSPERAGAVEVERTTAPAEGAAAELRRELARAPLSQARALLVGYVQRALRDALGLGATATVGHEQPLFELGVGSLTAVELRNRFQGELGVVLPSSLLLEHPTVSRLASHLLGLLRPGEPLAERSASDERRATSDAPSRRVDIGSLSESEAELRLLARLASLEEEMAR